MNGAENIFELLQERQLAGASEKEIYNSICLFLEQKARACGTPYSGYFELTPLCNLDCKMCYIHLNNAQLDGEKILSVDKWIDLMQQAIEAGMARACLTGGECLTYPHFDDLFLFLKSKGVGVTVLTNGVLLNPAQIDFFKKNMPNRIQISLYGDSDQAYELLTGKRAFSIVHDNILAAKEAGLPIKLAITPNRFMLGTVKDIIRLAKDLDVPYNINSSMMTPRNNTDRKKEDFDITADEFSDILNFHRSINGWEPKRINVLPYEEGGFDQFSNIGLRCGAGKSSFAIHWDGKMYPCIQMESISADPLCDGFSVAWSAINQQVNSYPCFTKCVECQYAQYCSFCPAENERLGSRFRLHPSWCDNTWKMIESGNWLVEPDCDNSI